MNPKFLSICLAVLAALPAPALAQVSLSAEAATDERRRGISWSDGDPVVRATISTDVAPDLSVEVDAVTLWGSARHRSADAAVDLSAQYSIQAGAWRLSAEGRYHLFPGASGQGYGEIGAGAGFGLGPANLDVFARYAPRQSAIGGDNLHIGAALSAGLPGTPLSGSAEIGRSSGSVRNPLNAARLRPGRRYWNHRLALDYHQGPWTAGLAYSGTSIERGLARRHAGDALVARVAHSF